LSARKSKPKPKRKAKRAPKPRKKRKRSGALVTRPVVAGAVAFLVLGLAGFWTGRGLGRAPGSGEYRETIARWCAGYGVNPDLAAAVVEVESGGRPRAVSSAGALGLMQLMPPTANAMATELGLPAPTRGDMFTPGFNIRLSRRAHERRPLAAEARRSLRRGGDRRVRLLRDAALCPQGPRALERYPEGQGRHARLRFRGAVLPS